MGVFYSFTLLFTDRADLTMACPLPPRNDHLIKRSLAMAIPSRGARPLRAFTTRCKRKLDGVLRTGPNTSIFLPGPNSRLAVPRRLVLPTAIHGKVIIGITRVHLCCCPPSDGAIRIFPVNVNRTKQRAPHG